jgi:hypothetical protein
VTENSILKFWSLTITFHLVCHHCHEASTESNENKLMFQRRAKPRQFKAARRLMMMQMAVLEHARLDLTTRLPATNGEEHSLADDVLILLHNMYSMYP